jgi:hypothetical protein
MKEKVLSHKIPVDVYNMGLLDQSDSLLLKRDFTERQSLQT